MKAREVSLLDFSGGTVRIENPPADAGDTGLICSGRYHMLRATKSVHHDY